MPGLYVPPQAQPPAYVQTYQVESSANAPLRLADASSGANARASEASDKGPPSAPVVSSALRFHAVPLSQTWTLKAGETISHGLEAWARQAHWTIVWQLPRDWSVPATTAFSGTFEEAAENVLRTLAAEGVLLKGEIYEGNHTLVVKPTGERE